jgi:hypothetical protein
MIYASAMKQSLTQLSMMHTIASLVTNGPKASVMIQHASIVPKGLLGQNREMMYDNAR